MKRALNKISWSLALLVIPVLQTQGQEGILEKTISISFKELSVEAALDKLMDKSDCYINYRKNDLPKNQTINTSYRQKSIAFIIKDIWGDTAIRLRERGTTISIQIPPSSAPKQKGTITGNITDQFNKPVPFASIVLKNTSYGASSDENGYFSFSVPGGSYIIATRSIGYEDTENTITVRPGQRVSVALKVVEKSEQLNEVKVYAASKKVELEESAKAVEVIETTLAKLETADLGEVLARTEGISIQRAGGLGSGTRFSLNGLTDDQIRFFLDGIPLDFMGFTIGIANVPVNLIDRAEVYKGVVPVNFGTDALGGAVNLVSLSNNVGTSGGGSYQVGSFGTHRVTLDFQHRPKAKGFFVSSELFYDFTNNDYKIDVEVPDERGRLSEATVERFHDGFKAFGGNVNIGIRALSWADIFSLRLFVSDFERDIQNNLIMTIPYGEVTSGGTNIGGLLRWKKKFEKGFQIDFSGGYSRSKTEFQDISEFVYNWFGERQRNLDGELVIRPNPGELGGPSDIEFVDDAYYGRLNLSQQLTNGHQLLFSSSPTYTSRTGENRIIEDPDIPDPLEGRNEVLSWVNGIEYEWNSQTEQWKYSAFVKHYVQNVFARQIALGGVAESERKTNEWGVGTGFRYQINSLLSVKGSYEWATRLPTATEIFGDGVLVLPNIDLRPERSNNANLTLNISKNNFDSPNWQINLNGFLRDVEDLIVLLDRGQSFNNQNVFGALSKGVEVSGYWTSANRRFQLNLGGTYQDFRNNSDEGGFSAFSGDRIPNRPYLFANGSIRYRFPRLFKEDNELTLFGNSRYVHDFFRSWESAGNEDFKQVIPEQLVHTAGLTYTLKLAGVASSITSEIQNLTNEKVFDFFGVQRPGRAFFIKFTGKF
ncbi:MAG: carboxypeptidase-like regulatory domain-containing protein [Bacteroidota bacterium]